MPRDLGGVRNPSIPGQINNIGVGYTVDGTQSSSAPELNSASPLMPQPVAGCAERHQVFRLVASSFSACHDVVDLQKTCLAAARGLATVLIPCQHLPAHTWGDCGRVAASVFTDSGVAAHPLGFGPAQFAFARIGLDGHASCG